MNKVYAVHYAFSEELRKMEERQAEFLSVDASAWDMGDDDSDDVKPYQVVNGVAVYAIRGKMMHESNFFTQIFGITTYEDIGNVMAAIAQDEEVDRVLISMSTPGGQVSGISDISDTWKQLDAVKPITVHTPGMFASAGIWLASNSSGGIYASDVAEVGSIGVIMSHVSYEENLKKQGIKVTDIKSSPKKAIGSPAKDLTSDEQEHLKAKVDEAASVFKRQIYRTRPSVTEEAFSGEVFIASEAQRVGLVDGVKNYSEVFIELVSAQAGTETNQHGMEEYPMEKKKVTASMFKAAVASGADPETMEIIEQEAYDALEGNGATEPDASNQEEPQEEPAAPEAAEPEMVEASVVDALGEELTAAQEALTVAESRIELLEAEADQESLRPFVVERLHTMRMALGLAKVDMSEFPLAAIATEYEAVDRAFKKAFKIGGVATGKKKVEEPKKASNITSLSEARLRSVGV